MFNHTYLVIYSLSTVLVLYPVWLVVLYLNYFRLNTRWLLKIFDWLVTTQVLCTGYLLYLSLSSRISVVLFGNNFTSFLVNWPSYSFLIHNGRVEFFFLFTISVITFFAYKNTPLYLYDSSRVEYFIFLLLSFTASMCFLVMSTNVILIFFFWELLGVFSFFLINYFSYKQVTLKASLKAFFFNKISDLFLYLFIIFWVYGSRTYSLSTQTVTLNWYNSTSLFFLITAAFIKSAQFIFFFWLPDSMEAPLPASALIHSATLVSAGVFLVLKLEWFFSNNSFVLYFFILLTLVGIIVFPFVAIFQTDIKKLLALSTIANCSFIYLLVFIHQPGLALVYFTVHGLLKSLIFLFAGHLIHINNHNQNLHSLPYPIKLVFNYFSVFGFLMFFLAAFNLTTVYSLKHAYMYSNGHKTMLRLIIEGSLLIYTTLSFMYATKVVFLLFYQKKHPVKTGSVKSFKRHTDSLHITYLYVYVTLIILLVLYYWFTSNNWFTNYNLQNYSSVIGRFTTLALIYLITLFTGNSKQLNTFVLFYTILFCIK